MKLDVNEKDNTNQSNSRSNDNEGEIPGQNDDNQTRYILEARETVSQVAEVRQTTITRQYFHKKIGNQIT